MHAYEGNCSNSSTLDVDNGKAGTFLVPGLVLLQMLIFELVTCRISSIWFYDIHRLRPQKVQKSIGTFIFKWSGGRDKQKTNLLSVTPSLISLMELNFDYYQYNIKMNIDLRVAIGMLLGCFVMNSNHQKNCIKCHPRSDDHSSASYSEIILRVNYEITDHNKWLNMIIARARCVHRVTYQASNGGGGGLTTSETNNKPYIRTLT